MVLRAAQGVLQGPVMPVMFHMAGSWMPNNEKTWLLSFMVSGKDRVSLRKIYRVSGPGKEHCPVKVAACRKSRV